MLLTCVILSVERIIKERMDSGTCTPAHLCFRFRSVNVVGLTVVNVNCGSCNG